MLLCDFRGLQECVLHKRAMAAPILASRSWQKSLRFGRALQRRLSADISDWLGEISEFLISQLSAVSAGGAIR
jgi:hypothetical protein